MGKHDAILTFIKEFIAQNGYAPTLREIGVGVSLLSTSNVHRYLKDLEKSGEIERESTKSRTIKIIS